MIEKFTINEEVVTAVLSKEQIQDILINYLKAETGINIDRNTRTHFKVYEFQTVGNFEGMLPLTVPKKLEIHITIKNDLK